VKTITELSDLVGNQELTDEYFSNRYKEVDWEPSLNTLENCIIHNMQDYYRLLSDSQLRDFHDQGYYAPDMLNMFPKGVIVPTIASNGFIELKTINGIFQYRHMCRANVIVPIKKKDEVYLIFPYLIAFSVAVEYLLPDIASNIIKVAPIYDIIVTPNHLLEDF